MSDFIQILIIIAGIILLIGFFLSIIKVALLNRHRQDLIAIFVGRLTYRILYKSPWNKKYGRNHQGRLWFLPLFIVFLILSWIIAVSIAYAFFYWATGSEPNFLQAIISSGSSLSTLGFHTPQPSYGELLAISEGVIGLFIIVFMFSFIPAYLSIIQSRDSQVGWLYARTNGKPSGGNLLKWFYANDRVEDLNRLWETWENWFRNLGMVNDLYPELALIPPFTQGDSWVLASVAVLDASSFVCSALEINGTSADLCYIAGVQAIQLIITSALWPKVKNIDKIAPSELSRKQFDEICAHLGHFNAPLKVDHEQAWCDFVKRRSQYETSLLNIGMAVQTPGIFNALSLIQKDGEY